MSNTRKHLHMAPDGGRQSYPAPAATLPAETGRLNNLRLGLKGRMITPNDPDYDTARTVFYGGPDRRPGWIVRPADAEDVIRVVNLARETGLELAVRSGGHSVARHSLSEGGIVLDLRDMNALQIDPESQTAWAETGLTTGEYTLAADAHGLATGFGDAGSVGIGGITLGGGIGYLVRKFGLTIDNVLAADIVTADGQLLHVDSDNHPDLFWAIRGGGGNFGVVTRFKYRLHPVSQGVGGMLILPATPEVIAGFIAEAEAAPDELSTIANIMPAPPMPLLQPDQHGQISLIASMFYAGEVAAGERVLAPFLKLAQPLVDLLRPMRYREMFPPEGGDYHPMAASHTMFVENIDRDAATTILEHLQASDAPMRLAQLRVLGGAVSRVPVYATAFAHRHSRIMVNLAALYVHPDEQPERQTWVNSFAGALQQGDGGAYVNFLGDEGPERLRAAYPRSTWDWLREIKALYDPTNLFRRNQNIPPEGEESI